MELDTELQKALDSAVDRIVELAHPEKIVLFGSAARGDGRPARDLDLLVIKSGVHRRHLAQSIYRHLHGIDRPIDVVVVTPEDIEKYRDYPWLVIGPALREGIVVYDQSAAA